MPLRASGCINAFVTSARLLMSVDRGAVVADELWRAVLSRLSMSCAALATLLIGYVQGSS